MKPKPIWVVRWHYGAEGKPDGITHIVCETSRKAAKARARNLKSNHEFEARYSVVVSEPVLYVPAKAKK